jgi:hypothetical protein
MCLTSWNSSDSLFVQCEIVQLQNIFYLGWAIVPGDSGAGRLHFRGSTKLEVLVGACSYWHTAMMNRISLRTESTISVKDKQDAAGVPASFQLFEHSLASLRRYFLHCQFVPSCNTARLLVETSTFLRISTPTSLSKLQLFPSKDSTTTPWTKGRLYYHLDDFLFSSCVLQPLSLPWHWVHLLPWLAQSQREP